MSKLQYKFSNKEWQAVAVNFVKTVSWLMHTEKNSERKRGKENLTRIKKEFQNQLKEQYEKVLDSGHNCNGWYSVHSK